LPLKDFNRNVRKEREAELSLMLEIQNSEDGVSVSGGEPGVADSSPL
jgi:hypothetical protein